MYIQTYTHPLWNLLKFASLKHAGFRCLGMIIVNLSFFFFLRGGEAAGNQRLSKSKKWYCHTSRMAVWCLFKRGGKKKKKKKQSRRLNHIFLPIRPCVPTSIITATCFIFSSAVLSDSHPRAMCCSVRPQIPQTWAERSWEILLSCTRDYSQSVLNSCRILLGCCLISLRGLTVSSCFDQPACIGLKTNLGFEFITTPIIF